jgi:hypothetical protein
MSSSLDIVVEHVAQQVVPGLMALPQGGQMAGGRGVGLEGFGNAAVRSFGRGSFAYAQEMANVATD